MDTKNKVLRIEVTTFIIFYPNNELMIGMGMHVLLYPTAVVWDAISTNIRIYIHIRYGPYNEISVSD